MNRKHILYDIERLKNHGNGLQEELKDWEVMLQEANAWVTTPISSLERNRRVNTIRMIEEEIKETGRQLSRLYADLYMLDENSTL